MSKERDLERRSSRSRSSSSHRRSRSRTLSRSRSRSRSPSGSRSHHSYRSYSKGSERHHGHYKKYPKPNFNTGLDPAFRDTNSTDPRAIAARVFVGNVPTDRVTKEEIIDIFSEYGRVTAVALLKGYCFIQFAKEEDARAAVDGRNNTLIKESKIDVKLAHEGRKKGGPPRDNFKGGWDRNSDRYRDSGSYERRRSPPPREVYEEDPYRRPSIDRDPYRRDPYERDPYLDRDPYTRDPYAPRDPYGPGRLDPRDPLAARDPRDPYPPRDTRSPPLRDPYLRDPRDPYAPPARDVLPPIRDPYARGAYPPVGVRNLPPPPTNNVDCEIIVVSADQKEYAAGVELRLKSRSMITSMNVLPDEGYLARATDDVLKRGLPYNIVINPQNERHRSITLKILHGTPQEHRNMPLDDALNLIARNFEEYTKAKREKDPLDERFKLPDQEVSYFLNLAADNRFLRIEELNKIIRYLTERRDALIIKEGGVVAGRETDANGLSNEAALEKQQHELQSKILSVLGDSASTSKAMSAATVLAPSSALAAMNAYADKPVSMAPQAVHSAVAIPVKAPSIDLNNPSVQQALNNLISSGGSFLANISQPPQNVAASSYTQSTTVIHAQGGQHGGYPLNYPRM